MKDPAEVGRDFDQYAREWAEHNYQMESSYERGTVCYDKSKAEQVVRPGDEWGDTAPLRKAYLGVVNAYAPNGRIDVLEIGAGGGRSTAVMLDVLGDRANRYHVVDVSTEFVKVLQQRIDRDVEVHVVTDVDLSFIATGSIGLCFSQSAWSHIGLYDQYRYLREIQRVLAPGGALYVHGQFLLGGGDSWTWNRFQRRVSQIDRSIEGVYHEFTSYDALAEMLLRLGYDLECIFSGGFVARRGKYRPGDPRAELGAPVTFPFRESLYAFLADGTTELRGVGGSTPVAPPPSPTVAANVRRFVGRAARRLKRSVAAFRRRLRRP
jgi:SAM-dependent methyltransferase